MGSHWETGFVCALSDQACRRGEPRPERRARRAIFHGASLLAIALLFSALWGAVARDRELLKPEVTDHEVNEILLAASPTSASTRA